MRMINKISQKIIDASIIIHTYTKIHKMRNISIIQSILILIPFDCVHTSFSQFFSIYPFIYFLLFCFWSLSLSLVLSKWVNQHIESRSANISLTILCKFLMIWRRLYYKNGDNIFFLACHQNRKEFRYVCFILSCLWIENITWKRNLGDTVNESVYDRETKKKGKFHGWINEHRSNKLFIFRWREFPPFCVSTRLRPSTNK